MVCCPGPGEDPSAQKLQSLGVTIISHLSIGDYMAVMSLATYIIGNDTGPMHLAGLMNTNCLTLFGATNPARTHPMGCPYLGKQSEWSSLQEVVTHIADKSI
jgi:heptosyltransferase-2